MAKVLYDRAKVHTHGGEVFTDTDLGVVAYRERGGYGRWLWCKYCHVSVLPEALIEIGPWGTSRMAVCSRCDAGLTAPEPYELCGTVVAPRGVGSR
jgi:hypothetical protein